jgi:hypothetical protein
VEFERSDRLKGADHADRAKPPASKTTASDSNGHRVRVHCVLNEAVASSSWHVTADGGEFAGHELKGSHSVRKADPCVIFEAKNTSLGMTCPLSTLQFIIQDSGQ